MSNAQKYAIENYSNKYCIEYKEEMLDTKKFFKNEKLCIEIGFGMGHATSAIAEKNPETDYLGVEVHTPGVGRLLSEIENRELKNLKIIQHDAVDVLNNMIADNSVHGFHIFFPDPWPKKKHWKRRLINNEFCNILVNKLKKDGYIYTATDWEDYALQMFEVFSSEKKLENVYEKWAASPLWRPETAFEHKGLDKNHLIRELYYKRV
ncbi:MAG: tRNA (guanosine(46)-N7)-methyltransferase TrmB [Spirochaetales bacterium]|nr:tRNA (guanosine(46)-N7)-methyltransferase TrmB [Spirochaetales bacterium]